MSQITEIIQSPLFVRQKKKLKKNQIQKLDDVIRTIMADSTKYSRAKHDLIYDQSV